MTRFQSVVLVASLVQIIQLSCLHCSFAFSSLQGWVPSQQQRRTGFRRQNYNCISKITLAKYPSRRQPRRAATSNDLEDTTSSSSSSSSTPRKSKSRTKGVYVRPSGAIERGSGFFIPGLEGPRVRLVFASILIGLTGLNHVMAAAASPIDSRAWSWSFEESMAIFYSLLVLLQAGIEFSKEKQKLLVVLERTTSGSSSSSDSPPTQGEASSPIVVVGWKGEWNTNISKLISKGLQEKIEWAAASFISATPATHMLYLQDDAIVYRLGNEDSKFGPPLADKDDDDGDDATETSSTRTTKISISLGVQAALEQLRQSKGGRVALPMTHPAVISLGFQGSRTVVLQRINDNSCWFMSSSDQLLASFTSADLKWLGQLAGYLQTT